MEATKDGVEGKDETEHETEYIHLNVNKGESSHGHRLVVRWVVRLHKPPNLAPRGSKMQQLQLLCVARWHGYLLCRHVVLFFWFDLCNLWCMAAVQRYQCSNLTSTML